MFTVEGVGATEVAVTPAGVCTVVAGVVVVATESAAPVFAAVPVAVAVNETVPAPAGAQVKVNPTVKPAAMVDAPGVAVVQVAEAPPVPVDVGVTVTPVADAPPAAAVFRTLAMSVTI